jgi:ferritin-like metal-binding protein YciE
MSMTPQDQLIQWLNDAYSLELSIAEVLQNHLQETQAVPDWHEKLQLHLIQTRRHADRVRECIGFLGGSVSPTKAFLGDLLGKVQAVSTGMYEDELVKNILAEHASEQLEIACYTALIAASEELGLTRVLDICREIKAEEEEMAHWVKQHISIITKMFLRARAAAGVLH